MFESDIVRDILTRYSLRPCEVVFIGDAETDYAAARVGLPFYLRETNYNRDFLAENPISGGEETT